MGAESRWLQAVTTAVAICLLGVSGGEASLVRAREGGSAELSCSLAPASNEGTAANLFPLHVVEWVRLGFNVPILIKFGVYAPRVHPNYKGRVSLTRGASLLVERLTLEDEGWFECRILLLESERDDFQNGTWTFLSITAPPVFIKTPPSFVEVLLGDSLTLSCGAHGNPRPTVVWHKDESRIERHEKIKVLNGTLSLASVTRNISGVYKCHVSNTEGNVSHSTQLQVKGPPIIIISPEDTTLNMSQDALLQCQADAYPSNLTYEWVKRGQNVYHIESLKTRVKVLVDGTLLIPNLIPEDAGNYTCIPTNGLLTPPSASACLTVKHPARVGRMQRETYLPAGMEGVIVCPVQADPPVLYVNWTKDGNGLNPDNYPGWIVNSEGSVFIATANDNAVGLYTCTAYNSYGTMGQSEPTRVVLKDPPSFSVLPRPEYVQEVGRELMVPCEASGDPTPNVTWTKIGSAPRSQYTVLANGSLLLQPLRKDHQGAWRCLATNRVASVSAGTVVMVLGTSPHAVSSVSVTTEMNQANVSWVPGFDGGYTQKFTVWVKQASRGKHEWASLPVPTSKSYLLVPGLLAGTGYQFSVLPQNKHGSGPFSEIVSVRTQAVPTEAPAAVTALPAPAPPTLLSANRSERGILLQWSPPSSPVTGYSLQVRRDRGQWVVLADGIGANRSELLVHGLLRDCSYDLRLMSRSNKALSEPSESVSVSTFGMEIYPLRPSFLEVIPEPLLAGVVGGVCFLFAATILSLVTACYMSQRRRRRRRRGRQDLPPALHKGSSPDGRSPPRSPDSVLKLKLCPPLPFFPNSSSSKSDRSSFDKGSRGEYHDQRRQLLSNSSPPPHYTLFESHLGSQAPSPNALESISRGPDGRFIIRPLQEDSSPSDEKSLKEDVLQVNGGASGSGSNRTSFRDSPKSSVLSSEKDDRKNSPLTVDIPELSRPPSSPGRVRAMAKNFTRHGCFYSDDEQSSEALLERASFYSDSSEKKPGDCLRRYRVQGRAEDPFPGLGGKAKPPQGGRPPQSDYQPMESQLTNDSTLVSQLDSEPERGSVNERVRSATVREKMERELESYRDDPRGRGPDERRSENTESPESEEEAVWKLHAVAMRPKHRPSGQASTASDHRRACYFGNTSSPMERLPASHIQWDISPVTSATKLVPAPAPQGTTWRPSRHPLARQETTDDSLAVDSSRSPVTQNTSLPTLSPDVSPDVTSEGLLRSAVQPPDRARSVSPRRERDAGRMSVTEEGFGGQTREEGVASRYRHSYAHAGTTRGPSGDSERPESSASAPCNQPKRPAEVRSSAVRDPGPSSYSTSPYERQEVGAKAKERETRPRDDRRSLVFYSELEREGVRTRSRRSDRCLFSDSPSPISTLTLVEEAESDQSQFSVARVSGSFRARPAAPSPKMSSLQASAILEYLSLPGFIEMSVDEPVGDAEVADTTGRRSEPKPEKAPLAEPDVVPRNWEVQERRETNSNQQVRFEKTLSAEEAAESGLDAGTRQGNKRWLQGEGRDPSLRVRFPDEMRPEKTSKQLLDEKTRNKRPDRPDSRPAHTLFGAAKGVAEILSRHHTHGFVDGAESLSDRSQRPVSQGSRVNNIASRLSQAPVPFLKKSFSVGPCRAPPGFGQPRPFLKKSVSLGSQRWEHFESPRTYVSERCYWDEFPNPDVRSYSLGRGPPSFPRPGPSWREYVPFRRPSVGSLERPHHAQRPLASPPYLAQSMYPPRQTSFSPMPEPSDPRRQAAVFPEATGWSPSCQPDPRSAQYPYIPMPSSVPGPQYQHWPGSRGESMRPVDPRRGPPRSHLPRGISWPSPCYAPAPPREAESYRQPDRLTGRGGEAETREGGRASYASQSSGRGSAGLFRQSLSVTPTLLSSPETTEESERHRAETELPERRAKRRNTSVDESYEWDSADAGVDHEVLEAMRFDGSHVGLGRGRGELRHDQAGGLQDQQRKGPSPSVSPPASNPPRCQYSRSLSEARFNALRQEYQEYRRAQESTCSREPGVTAGHVSDSDSNSALL